MENGNVKELHGQRLLEIHDGRGRRLFRPGKRVYVVRPMGGVLFVENHDSFSWNVLDALPVPRAAVRLCRADQAVPLLSGAALLVVGPGPMDPERAGLLEVVREALRRGLPTLGVCLGHQALGLALGARLTRLLPTFGHAEVADFAACRLFPGVRGPLQVMRYHALGLTDVPPPLEVVATGRAGAVLAVAHRTLPAAGVQFHPDSFGTPGGRALLRAFFEAASPGLASAAPAPSPALPPPSTPPWGVAEVSALDVRTLEDDASFALLAPGYTGAPAWLLARGLEAGDARGGSAVWLRGFEPSPQDRCWVPREVRWVEPKGLPAAAPPRVSLDDEGALEAVEAIRLAIAAGDVYQVNHTLRATVRGLSGAELLGRLCRRGVPRLAAWVRLPGLELVSASPELLFEADAGAVHVEPMKGTAGPGEGSRLLASAKDRAELAMITDLLRDDLQRLCLPGSVQVLAERRLVELPYAVQAVSDVTGALAPDTTTARLLDVLHPGGSVTGTPRPAALRFIRALEPLPRGMYCGALALQHQGLTRAALLIRTAQRRPDGDWTYGVGSGITFASDARAEVAEMRLKLGAL